MVFSKKFAGVPPAESSASGDRRGPLASPYNPPPPPPNIFLLEPPLITSSHSSLYRR